MNRSQVKHLEERMQSKFYAACNRHNVGRYNVEDISPEPFNVTQALNDVLTPSQIDLGIHRKWLEFVPGEQDYSLIYGHYKAIEKDLPSGIKKLLATPRIEHDARQAVLTSIKALHTEMIRVLDHAMLGDASDALAALEHFTIMCDEAK